MSRRLLNGGWHLPSAAEPRNANGRCENFEEFYGSQYRSTLQVAFALTGQWAIAEEITQEAFLRAYRRWCDVGCLQRPDAWVNRVAINLARSRWRRVAAEGRALARAFREARSSMPEPLPEELDVFWEAVRSLPRRQAEAVALHYVNDMSIADIAAVMKCAEGTVKAHLHKGRATLAQRLAPTRGH